MTIQDDIATCLKMLRARGGALDVKAANLLQAMDEAGVEQNEELKALDDRVRALERDARIVAAREDNATPANADGPDETRLNLIHALAPLLDRKTINNWSTADLAQLLATEWRGAVQELREIVGRLSAVTYAPVSDSPILLAIAAIDEITKLRERVAQTTPATPAGFPTFTYAPHHPATPVQTVPGSWVKTHVAEMKTTGIVVTASGEIWNADLNSGYVWPRVDETNMRSEEDGNI